MRTVPAGALDGINMLAEAVALAATEFDIRKNSPAS
jgi:hypothetical protein